MSKEIGKLSIRFQEKQLLRDALGEQRAYLMKRHQEAIAKSSVGEVWAEKLALIEILLVKLEEAFQ